MELGLNIALIGLLAATLYHAVRLERALGVLKRDRMKLGELVAGFSTSTREAELGVERLRATADGAGQQIQRQIDTASSLKDDLDFLIGRGDQLADRLETLVRAAREAAPDRGYAIATEETAAETQPMAWDEPEPQAPAASWADAWRASATLEAEPEPALGRHRESEPRGDEPLQRVRSQAERDLLKALRMVR